LKDALVFIGVIGGNEPPPEAAGVAEEVGREIARRGAVLVCGGLGGVMEAACRGAAAEGGLTVGILPGDDRRAANPYVRIPVVTGLGSARNVAVVRSSQAVIAIDGGYGTLSEIGHALQSGIPVIGLDTWSLATGGNVDAAIITAATPAEAVDIAFALLGRPARQQTGEDNVNY
jgi:hypothetical protein